MKKAILFLCIAIALVAAVSLNVTAATKNPWSVCHGVVRAVDLVNHPQLNGATCTLVENGWYMVTAPDNNFYLFLHGSFIPAGTYHLRVTKPGYNTAIITFYYSGTDPYGTNLGDILLSEI